MQAPTRRFGSKELWDRLNARRDRAAQLWEGVGPGRYIPVAILLMLIALPLDPSKDEVLVSTGFFALAALGLNVVVGLAGLLDLGYVAFFMIGAYTVGLLTESNTTIHPAILAPWIVLPIAVFVAMCTGLLLGTPTLRLRGDYLAIVTLGFHEITLQTAKNLEFVNGSRGIVINQHPDIFLDGASKTLAGVVLVVVGVLILYASIQRLRQALETRRESGALGIAGMVGSALFAFLGLAFAGGGLKFVTQGAPVTVTFNVLEPQAYWFVIVVFMVITMFLIGRLKDSRIGRAWEAIREDEVAAAAMGIPVVKLKLYAFAIGASTSGLAGWALATKVGFINPNTFPLLNSILVLCAVVIGGIGSSAGAVLGAAIVFGVPELLRELGTEKILGFDVLTGRIAIFGFILVIMMIFRPGGVITTARRRAELGTSHGDIAGDTSSVKSVDA